MLSDSSQPVPIVPTQEIDVETSNKISTNTSTTKDDVEKKALFVGTIVNVIMGISGIGAGFLSNSEALKLDGYFSLISAMAIIVAVRISGLKAKATTRFPFGLFIYESLYSFMLGLLTMGIIIVALIDNIAIIIRYINGERKAAVDPLVIIIYSVLMVLLCFGLAAYYRRANKAINNISIILRTYTTQSKIDGIISSGAGIALTIIAFIDPNGALGFMTSIGDSILVVLLVLGICIEPIQLMRDSFFELVGGSLTDEKQVEKITKIVLSHIEPEKLHSKDLFISKTGSSYFIVAELELSSISSFTADSYTKLKIAITKDLQEKISPFSIFEMVFSADETDKIRPIEEEKETLTDSGN